MTTQDHTFALLVYFALPPTFFYPLIYGLTTRWWESWIGRALFIKAVGVFILMLFSALFHIFGPDYFARDTVRIGGMIFASIGFYLALLSLLDVKVQTEQTFRFWRWSYPMLNHWRSNRARTRQEA